MHAGNLPRQVISESLTPALRQIGQILVDDGLISPTEITQILHSQQENGLKFGEAAKLLNLISEQDLLKALAQQFDYPYLPTSAAADNGLDPTELVTAFRPFSTHAEAFRALRTQLVLRWFQGEARSLAIVSPSRGDGRSYVAANLAVVFSQLGSRTILVDADLEKPRQHLIFGHKGYFGLSSILAGHGELSKLSPISVFENLAVLPSGPIPPNPQELLQSSRFRGLLDLLNREYDVVLIDTPPVQENTSAQTVAARTGGALVLACKHKARLNDLAALKDVLESTGTQIVGSILNQP